MGGIVGNVEMSSALRICRGCSVAALACLAWVAAPTQAQDQSGAPFSVPGAEPRDVAQVDDLSGAAASVVDDLNVGPQSAEGIDDLSEEGQEAAFRTEPSEDSLLPLLLQKARAGEGDPHLPYVLHRLEQAMAAQDVIAFLDLVDSAYFADQFALHVNPERSPGRSLHFFTCEFFSLCDVSKSYAYKDVVSAKVINIQPQASGPLMEVSMELQVWDGLFLTVEIFYDPRTARLLSAGG